MASCVGLISPGEMGAAVGGILTENGTQVVSPLADRGAATHRRAEAAGITDVSDVEALLSRADVVLSVVPPGSALDVAGLVAAAMTKTSRRPVFVDANAVSPARAWAIKAKIEDSGGQYVDGGILGGPPGASGGTCLYLSGDDVGAVAPLFEATTLATVDLGQQPTAASALKMCFAAWTKGSGAMLLALRAVAVAEGVEEALLAAWANSLPDLPAGCELAALTAPKAWRFVDEMREIAATFEASGLPRGFHLAAADVYERLQDYKDTPRAGLEEIVRALLARGT